MRREERHNGSDRDEEGGPGYGDYEKDAIKVSLVFYLVSIIAIALLVFILMLVQYLPGYRTNHRLSQVIKNSDVNVTITIPMAEVEKREPNPFTKKQRDSVAEMLKGMGAKSARVVIQPEGAQ